MKINDAQHERLRELERSTQRRCDLDARLEAKGLVCTGEGRYGTWARLTHAGVQYLARTASKTVVGLPSTCGSDGQTEHYIPPAAAPGPTEHTPVQPGAVGYLLRGAAPRTRRNAATHARSDAAISPPAAAQDVGADSSMAGVKPATRKAGEKPDNGMRKPHPGTASFIAPRTRRGT